MLITPREVFDLIAMSLILGFIFKDIFKPHQFMDLDGVRIPLRASTLNWKDIGFAALVTAPAVVLHELAHKFVAIAFGVSATFYTSYTWLFIGLLLKMFNSPILFFIPGYVQHAATTNLQGSLIALAGPLMNLIIFVICYFALKNPNIKQRYKPVIGITKQVNLFLFIFNMLPIPPFDGFQFISGLLKAIF
ncbi:M50 family metallopeptidase [Candidatus Woesearchaeota archaeon]|nr:M50 family metallopeptidase [Candidatus Woesearchaeota archaeon]